MEQITSSYNLFVDTSRSHTTGSKGDDFLINLQDAGVHAGEGEFIRLNLENFSMAKNFSDVNDNNNHFRVRATADGTNFLTNQDVRMGKQNHKSVFDLATDFKDTIANALEAMGATFGTVALKTGTLKPESASMGSTDNVIEFTLTYTGTLLTSSNAKIYVQCFSEESDSYALIGGDRIEGALADNLKNSISVEISNSVKEIAFSCLYPAQRATMPFIYIRAPGVLNTNIETKGLKNHKEDHKSDTAHSDILGRVVVASSEWVQYTSETGREFFLDIHQKSLNFLRLRLTDSRNRPIGRNNTVSNTATGGGTEQSTLGNLNFSAVIRFDIIKRRTVQHLETQHYVPSVPARFSSGVVKQLRDGQDTYFKNPGM